MTPEQKIRLLKRKFQSIEYIEQFVAHYQRFIDVALNSLVEYKQYKMKTLNFLPTLEMQIDERLWDKKVKPNFIGMKLSSEEALENAKNGIKTTVRSLAADFRGLSKSMDGIRESFMDVLDPSIKEEYLSLWKITSMEASNIEDTINDWWKDGELLKENITGPIDEQELLNYLEPGESI